MGMVVQHNIAALNSNRQLGVNNSALSKNLEKLSSGYRINRAGDDAAGLAISEKMRAQIKGLDAAQSNAQDGISLVQTAEGALTEVHSMLNRMTELATKAANGTFSETDRQKYSDEVDALKDEIDRISESTNFNGINLLDGSLSGTNVTANGTTLSGARVAKFTKANIEGTTFATGACATSAGKDYFDIDGQVLTIDWASNNEAATVLAGLEANANSFTADTAKDYAKKLTDVFNNAMKDQGLRGSVKVTATHTGTTAKFKLESQNNGAGSKVGWTGCEKAAASLSVGSKLFSTSAGVANVGEATKTYDGKKIANASTFQMKINGTTVQVKLTADIDQDSELKNAATTLQAAIQTAVGDYNTQNSLSAGQYDSASGLTGLNATDFTAEVGDNGNIVVKYKGDEDIKFSFSDVGDKQVAAALGLASGSSKSGGATGLQLQIGETDASYQKVNVSIDKMDSLSLGLNNVSIADEESAGASIDVIKDAINKVSTQRGSLGAIQNRLEHTINSLSVSDENLTAAESRIRDTDMAKEMMAYTQNNVLTQAAQSMLAQANQKPQAVLSLLQ